MGSVFLKREKKKSYFRKKYFHPKGEGVGLFIDRQGRSYCLLSSMMIYSGLLFVGPAFNIFLRLCDFQLGPFIVNKYTAPGVRLPKQKGTESWALSKIVFVK